ncbi:MAG: helix-turn-helix transcriptional regulator [Erysipelotrichaceae bacterium]
MDQNYSKELGIMILRKMQELEITQVMLAKKLNIQQSTLSLYINGKRDMSISDAMRISNELNLGLEFYFEAGNHHYIMNQEEYFIINSLRSIETKHRQKTMEAIKALLIVAME